jgi:ribosomal protein L13E
LSSRPKKGRSEKKPEVPKAKREKPSRPAGKTPQAIVTARHGTGSVTRAGRGFSMGELSSAGIDPHLASSWGLRLDARRRSLIPGNLDTLKKWGTHPGLAKKAEGRLKEAEEEVERVAREVKAEAVKAEKKAAKIEKEVKGEAVGAGKAVERGAKKAEKAVKRKARPKKKAES